MERPSLPGVLLIVLSLASPPSLFACTPAAGLQGDPCLRTPPGAVFVTLEGSPVFALEFAGTIDSIEPIPDLRASRVTVRRDGAGETLRLIYRQPEGGVPFPTGHHFNFRVEHAPGFPGACAIVMSDEKGLAFAAASDDAPGRTVLRQGVPGFVVEFLPSECRSRPTGKCYDAIVNRPLKVRRDGSWVRLMHGETADIAGYRVDCLTSQEVTYNKNCADAGVIALSYRIMRSDLKPAGS